ncbi:MAG: proprotein convertase P-domain-containing protein [Myxococcota bacterium]
MSHLSRCLSFAVAAALLAACGDTGPSGPAVEPPLIEGKSDAADRVSLEGELLFDTPRTGAFEEDLAFFGYVLAVRPGAKTKIEVTQKGSAKKLNSTLFVYGPRGASGFGTKAIAADDDAGWGRLSRLDGLTFAEGGEYLVVVGTHDARGRGQYRLVASCLSGACEPEPPAVSDPVCHPAIAAAIEGCVADTQSDPESAQGSELEALELCADAEVVGAAHDEACAADSEAPSFCQLAYEDFAAEQLPLCRAALAADLAAAACVLGSTWREALRAPGILVGERRVVTSADGLDSLAQAQLVLAVQASSHTDVTTAAEALARVDGQEINVVGLFDGTHGRAYVGYEYGAGDNSYGRIFEFGTTVDVARIQDGDLVGCSVALGPELRDCGADADCASGLKCTGRSPNTGVGRCVATSVEPVGSGDSCSGEAPCAWEAGLWCAGVSAWGGEGLCLPAWMQARFASSAEVAIPDGVELGADLGIEAYGLATVATDAWLRVVIRHPAVEQLHVSLEDPASTDVVVYDGESSGADLVLDLAVRGIPGDESVNGRWTLHVRDLASGQAGVVESWELRLGSRWD